MSNFELIIDITDLHAVKDAIENTEDNLYGNLSSASSFATVTIRDRIERKGQTADGRAMESKSAKKTGKYSRGWGNKRKAAGLRVDVVNLSFTGRTLKEFGRIHDTLDFRNNAVTMGFERDDARQIAEWNNEMFGPAYDIGQREIDETFQEYIGEFNNLLFK